MDPLAELLATTRNDHTPMRHRMRAAQQALRAMPTNAEKEIWHPFRALFDEVLQRKPPFAEALRADAANIALWWDGRRRPTVAVADIAEPNGAAAGGGLSHSLRKVRAVMLDDGCQLHRRLDAAEILLDHELAPGGGVGVPPEQIASEAFQFLRVVEASNAREAHRFRALRSIVRIENHRKAAVQSPGELAEKRRVLRHLAAAAHRAGESFTFDEGQLATWEWPTRDFAKRLDKLIRQRRASRMPLDQRQS